MATHTETRRHVVITGTGRAGTTFLVELLTHLGYDTGFTPETANKMKDRFALAGLEHDIRVPGAPYVVKSPWFVDYARDVVSRDDIAIDHVIIPYRELRDAVHSRLRVTKLAIGRMAPHRRLLARFRPPEAPGGVWHTRSLNARRQESVLLRQAYELMYVLSGTQIPVTLLQFPQMVQDPVYLSIQLRRVFPVLDDAALLDAFRQVANTKLVHSFSE